MLSLLQDRVQLPEHLQRGGKFLINFFCQLFSVGMGRVIPVIRKLQPLDVVLDQGHAVRFAKAGFGRNAGYVVVLFKKCLGGFPRKVEGNFKPLDRGIADECCFLFLEDLVKAKQGAFKIFE